MLALEFHEPENCRVPQLETKLAMWQHGGSPILSPDALRSRHAPCEIQYSDRAF